MTDVAIAIVTYKSADLTIDCLRSIEQERGASNLDIVVIVVDNASGDGPPIAKAINDSGWSSWVKLVVAPRNGGFAYGNNLAIREASRLGPPRYCHLLNPDTILRSGAVEKLVAFLEVHPTVGIAGGSFENLDGSDWPIAFRFPTLLSEIEARMQFGLATRLLRPWVVARQMSPVPQPIDWVPGASMMVRWQVFESVGGFDENYFLYFEETDFSYRAKRKGFTTWYVPDSRVMHIAGQSTKITERNAKPKRLPAYWFESRRRFFARTYGLPYAIMTDLLALLAYGAGSLKRWLLGQKEMAIPFFASDLLKQSIIWPSNRRFSPIDSASTGLTLGRNQKQPDNF
jgi:N-acetylglucosaminyl-diphospho-decaprenol L-rhamnosyltransferase